MMLANALSWVKRNQVEDGGVFVSSVRRNFYPEVSGYFIPTLLSCGERQIARKFATTLMNYQNQDGSFSGPDGGHGIAFDTCQVIRGWVSILDEMPELEDPVRKACKWIIDRSELSGRLPLPDPISLWSMGKRGMVSEAVHLYGLPALITAGQKLGELSYRRFVTRSRDYYLRNCDLVNFHQPNMLTHFFAYIHEALIDLGAEDKARAAMQHIYELQAPNGAIPAYRDVKWICTPGQIQLALIWYKLGEYELGNSALAFIERLINPSGGFFGSYGIAAEYFPGEEISWATKFYIDATWMKIQQFFNKENLIFPDKIDAKDERLTTICDQVGDINGKTVLDVGCGKGRFLSALKNQYPEARLVGIDMSEELLQCVPSNIETHHGTMLNMPFEENQFDFVFSVEALEHAVQIGQALREMSRVLKPGGKLIVIDKNIEHWGKFETPVWEKWFEPDRLKAEIEKHCDAVHWKHIGYDVSPVPDGLFVVWWGDKKLSAQIKTSPNYSSVQHGQIKRLDPDSWHESIIGKSIPEEIAARVKSNQLPDWFPVLEELTQEGNRVLELGSGTGELSAALALRGRNVCLLDYSSSSLDFSKKLFELLGIRASKFVQADITRRFPFDSNEFDLVWSSGLLEHFDEIEVRHILKESQRVTKSKVLSLVPNARSIAYRIGKWNQEATGKWLWGYEKPILSLKREFELVGLTAIEEKTVAPFHSLEFLSANELGEAKAEFRRFYQSISSDELESLNQGYLIRTVGQKQKKLKLGIVPSDPIEAYEAAGYGSWLKEYYNPLHFFDEVYCVSPLETRAKYVHGMHVVPTSEKDFHFKIRELGLDVIRAYGGFWPSDLVCSNKLPDLPTIVSVHDSNPSMLNDSVLKADHVISLSKAIKDVLVARGVAPENIHDFKNRVDLNIFKPLNDKQDQYRFRKKFDSKYLILHVGRKSEEKNLETLIEALRFLGKDFAAIFIGRGDDEQYKEVASELGVLSQCFFIDSVPNEQLPKFYSYCDCMCTPSKWEGFGIVFIEALACNSVVITSDIAPMNEYIENGVNGLLVKEFENPDKLASQIFRACKDNALRKSLKKNARKAARHFSKDIVDALEVEIYKKILSMDRTGNFAAQQMDMECQNLHGCTS